MKDLGKCVDTLVVYRLPLILHESIFTFHVDTNVTSVLTRLLQHLLFQFRFNALNNSPCYIRDNHRLEWVISLTYNVSGVVDVHQWLLT